MYWSTCRKAYSRSFSFISWMINPRTGSFSNFSENLSTRWTKTSLSIGDSWIIHIVRHVRTVRWRYYKSFLFWERPSLFRCRLVCKSFKNFISWFLSKSPKLRHNLANFINIKSFLTRKLYFIKIHIINFAIRRIINSLFFFIKNYIIFLFKNIRFKLIFLENRFYHLGII